MKLKEQIKGECRAEFEAANSAKIEQDMKVKFELEAKELQSKYEEKLAKQEEETAILKKTLLE